MTQPSPRRLARRRRFLHVESLEERRVLATFAPTDVAGLVAAIETANNNGEEDAIDLGGGTFSLTEVDNEIDGANGLPSILGDGGRPLTIVKGVIRRIDGSPAFRILHVAEGAQLTLDGVTVDGGLAQDSLRNAYLGGGIFNQGKLTLSSSTLSQNAAQFGGGVYNRGELSATSSRFTENTAIHEGAGIMNHASGRVVASIIRDSVFVGNSADEAGGGMFNDSDGGGRVDVALTDSIISGNKALERGGGIASRSYDGSQVTIAVSGGSIVANSAYFGGGIFNGASADLSLTESDVAGNSAAAGGGIFNRGRAVVSASRISRNVGGYFGGGGGGVFNDPGGYLTITGSTVSGNSATVVGAIANFGQSNVTASAISENEASSTGGLFNGGEMTLANSTISGNVATDRGGGINNNGRLEVIASTISGNSAGDSGGIMNDGIASLYSTLVSGNAGDEGPDLNGVFDAAFSLIGDTTSADITDLGNNFFDVDPLLGPLRNNGGPSMTHALLPGSPAVDMGVANLYGSDQRGMSRVVTITNEETPGGGADIGAFELQSRELLFAAGRETAKRLSGIAAAQAGIDDVARHKAVRRSALARNRAPWNLSP